MADFLTKIVKSSRLLSPTALFLQKNQSTYKQRCQWPEVTAIDHKGKESLLAANMKSTVTNGLCEFSGIFCGVEIELQIKGLKLTL